MRNLLIEEVKKLFTKLSTDPTTASQLAAKEPAIFTGSEVRMFDDDMPLAQFAVAFSGAPWTDPDSIALMVIQSLLGSWNKDTVGGKHMGSELVQRVGINELAESMMAFNTNYKDTGLFGVYAVAKPDCLDDLAWAVMQEVSKLSYRVSDEDVTRACNQLKSSLLLHVDGTSPVAEDIGQDANNSESPVRRPLKLDDFIQSKEKTMRSWAAALCSFLCCSYRFGLGVCSGYWLIWCCY